MSRVIHPYATRLYAESLPHMGEALEVPEWGGHVLGRPVPGEDGRDAQGPYPLAVISADADLQGGLERLRLTGLVSVTLVVDAHHRPPPDALDRAFDVVRPFKTHYLNDSTDGAPGYTKHHRYEVRRAHARVTASEFALADHLDAWCELYRQLTVRHDLSGTHAFPLAHHAALARLPGVRAFGAWQEDRLVSAHLFVTHEGHATSHLAASAPEGYASGAAYAVNDAALRGLACDVVNLGGGAGASNDPADPLARFKKGFSNRTASSYICGKVLDRAAYDRLSAGRDDGAFFPAYRGIRQNGGTG